MNPSYIYIISDNTAIKVGISIDPNKRIKELQTGNPKKLSILYTFKVPENLVFKLESACHKALQCKFIKRGEWFQTSGFSARLIVDEICEPHLIKD